MRTRGLIELATAIIRKNQPDGFDSTYSDYETGVIVRHSQHTPSDTTP